jgi:hypothetical protein
MRALVAENHRIIDAPDIALAGNDRRATIPKTGWQIERGSPISYASAWSLAKPKYKERGFSILFFFRRGARSSSARVERIRKTLRSWASRSSLDGMAAWKQCAP